MGSKGAKRGYKRETRFVNLIESNINFKKGLESALKKMGIAEGEILSAKDVKSRLKSDVNVVITTIDDIEIEIGFSLKSAEIGFNQLDRRWLDEWVTILDMPKNIQTEMQSSLDRKIINSRDVFILESQEKEIISFFYEKIEILLKELFTREDENLKILVVYDENKHKWYMMKIEDIIQNLIKEKITRTNKGILKIGNYLSMQRKGGDGNITTVPKSSKLHPSNHIQFKINPLEIKNTVNHIELLE